MGLDVSGDAKGETALEAAFSHVDGAGRARMVDVTGKPWTSRRAVARCRVNVPMEAQSTDSPPAAPNPAVGGADLDPESSKRTSTGLSSRAWAELISSARITGIQAAKRTAELVPLCHPLTLSNVDVRLSITKGAIDVEGEAEVIGPTGVEMEALTACAFAALAIVSSLEETHPDVSVEALELLEKRGGRSGTWIRPPRPAQVRADKDQDVTSPDEAAEVNEP